MLGEDRGAAPAELFAVLEEGPQGALAVREAGLLGASGVQREVPQAASPAREAGLLEVFAGPEVTEPWEPVDLEATGLWVYADLAVIVW